jgi:putative ABC transport system permease protein
MKILKLIFANALRHKLRAFLTIAGIMIAVIAFGVLRTVVTVWDSSVEAAAANRLITRQAVSFLFPLPYAYNDKIKNVDGVKTVTFANWFGGIYKDPSNFFARMAVDPETIFIVMSEFLISDEELQTFKKERNSCVIGSAIAQKYNLKVGDQMVLDGDIFPGRWEFTVRGIYKPKFKNTDATQMLFHWDYVNERMKIESPTRAGDVGWYIVLIDDQNRSAEISENIDALFKNSSAETKTETEKAFTQGFVSASGAIITAMNYVSFIIIGIIMLVLGNTMIMAARERTREYAVLKTLGFSALHIVGLILGESMVIAVIGGVFGIILTYPIVAGFENLLQGAFPFFFIEPITVILAMISALLTGLLASLFPIQRALKTKIVDGFRFVG